MSKALIPGATNKAHATRVIPDSTEVRFLDAFITAGLAAGAAIWTATRKTTGQQIGWSLFLGGLGIIGAVEGKGSLLRYGGFGLAGSQAAFLALRAADPNLVPNPTANFAQIEADPTLVPYPSANFAYVEADPTLVPYPSANFAYVEADPTLVPYPSANFAYVEAYR